MHGLGDYTAGELRLIVRREKLELVKELSIIEKRAKVIHERLAELAKAEVLLEGEL